jgi:hypothetical protein
MIPAPVPQVPAAYSAVEYDPFAVAEAADYDPFAAAQGSYAALPPPPPPPPVLPLLPPPVVSAPVIPPPPSQDALASLERAQAELEKDRAAHARRVASENSRQRRFGGGGPLK